ncbi:MAG: C40 family peptidase [Gammaproteobacteria bacterium]|nr:C40 family peptidase [Gammaproteobacteria bacterium]MBU2676099.1 C40 family peptidase [Gammaproteobacteria bacterium]NNC56337.1 C40 family peptidase [Woeseiaceae bacterium]NNL49835.1 C40 family peptidase [Woeseiaceae bacterium]
MIAQPARIIRSFALAITMLGLASACSSTAVSWDAATPRVGMDSGAPAVGARAAAIAVDQVGVPYRYGGSTPGGFDCSGLVQYSYSQAGKRVPRTTGQLWSSTIAVQPNEMRVGDVLFFKVGGKMSHVGLYLGRQRFVHAPSSGRRVAVASLDSPFYKSAFMRAGRPQ